MAVFCRRRRRRCWAVRRPFDIDEAPTTADIDFVANSLEVFNEALGPGHQEWKSLGVSVRDQQTIRAGLMGETYAGWPFVRYLWVAEDLRGQGVGRRLPGLREQHGQERGCHAVFLDTFSFQALGFCRKLGYTMFGELDWSPDHRRYFPRKALEADAGRGGLNPAQCGAQGNQEG